MAPILTARTAVVAGLLAATAPRGVHAHHSVTGSFDPGRSIVVTGEVIEWRFRNPDSLLVVEGIATIDGAADAEPNRWEIESSPSAAMREMGFDENTFFAGRKVTVSGIPHRNPSLHRINAFANRGAFRDEDGNPIGEGSFIEGRATATVAPRSVGVERLEGLWQPPFQPNGPTTPLALTEAG